MEIYYQFFWKGCQPEWEQTQAAFVRYLECTYIYDIIHGGIILVWIVLWIFFVYLFALWCMGFFKDYYE